MSPHSIPEKLIADVAAGNAAPFVGAGLSIGAGYPSWSEFCRELLAELDGEFSDQVRSNNLLIAELYQQKFKRGALLEKIRKRFLRGGRGHEPTESHEMLARFGWTEVFTTNWDELLEKSFANPNPIYSSSELSTLEADQVGIIYLHGSPRRPDTIAITATDYHRAALYDDRLFWRANSKTLLFLGVSLTDDHLLRMRVESQDRPSYAALFDFPDDLVELYKTRNIHVLPLTEIDGSKTKAVAQFLKDLHAAVENRQRETVQTRKAMRVNSLRFESKLGELLHEDNAKTDHVWVINGVDFARYTNFFVDLIDLMQNVYSESTLDIYNVYQPLYFFLDMLSHGSEHLRRAAIPQLSEILDRFSHTYLREEQLSLSAQFATKIFPCDDFVSERARKTVLDLSELLFPSLGQIASFAQSNPERFVRTTVLSSAHERLTTANHFRLFDVLMKTPERHFLVRADDFRTYAKTRYVHGSDFCLWENDEATAVTDYYPDSRTLVVGWVSKESGTQDPGAQRYVGYFQEIYRNLGKFPNRRRIDQYITDLEFLEQSARHAGAGEAPAGGGTA